MINYSLNTLLQPMRKNITWAKSYVFFLFLVFTLYGCGESAPSPNIDSNDFFVSNTYVGGFTTALAKSEAASQAASLSTDLPPEITQDVVTSKVKYDVVVSKMVYKSKTPDNQDINVSGLVVRPIIPSNDSRQLGIICVMHGTLTDVKEAPSLTATDQLQSVNYLFAAAMGAIVILPDYIGYGETEGMDHPYDDVSVGRICTDMILATKEAFKDSVSISDRVLLAGYSEGGNSCVATHKYIEENNPKGIQIVESIDGAGSIDKINFAKAVVQIRETSPFLPFYFWVMKAYKDIYNITSSYDEVFAEPFNGIFKAIDYDFSFAMSKYITLANGQIAINQQAVQENPALQAAFLVALSQQVVVADILNPSLVFKPSFIRDVVQEAESVSQWITAFKKNTIIDWAPQAKLTMVHGDQDSFVLPLNSINGEKRMKSLGGNVVLKLLPGATHSTAISGYSAVVLESVLSFVQ